MAKILDRRIFLLLSIVLAISICLPMVPKASAEAKMGGSDSAQKALSVIADVLGIDLTRYRLNLTRCYREELLVPHREVVEYVLTSNNSKLRVRCELAGGGIYALWVFEREGAPHMKHPVGDVLEMARDVLAGYEVFSGLQHVQEMRRLLENVDALRNLTVTSGNMRLKLEILKALNRTYLKWAYSFNGVEASHKSLVLIFEGNFLKFLGDKWHLYRIGSHDIRISKEEAIKLAVKAAKNHSWKVYLGNGTWTEVKAFNIAGVSEATLFFTNGVWESEARNGDPLTLYPLWRIRLYLDKLYPGNVYGIYVMPWADTGEIYKVQEMILMGSYPSGSEDIPELANEGSLKNINSNKFMWASMLLLIGTIIVTAITTAICKMRKASTLKLNNRALRCGVIVFLLASFTLTMQVIGDVKADSRGVMFYGSRWNMTLSEQQAAQAVIEHMTYNFQQRDYECMNAYGENTQKENVLNWTALLEQAYDWVGMFHHGHGGMHPNYTQHRDYFDDDGYYYEGDQIWDYEVYPKTGGKHYFVIIWACRQGDYVGGWGPLGVYGMPHAWHHTTNLPSDGPYCFIGFEDASMPLTQTSKHNASVIYRDFVMYFDYYAIYHGYPIIQALNQASWDLFGENVPTYYDTELYQGFTAYWPNMPEGEGRMKIYGNINLVLTPH